MRSATSNWLQPVPNDVLRPIWRKVDALFLVRRNRGQLSAQVQRLHRFHGSDVSDVVVVAAVERVHPQPALSHCSRLSHARPLLMRGSDTGTLFCRINTIASPVM